MTAPAQHIDLLCPQCGYDLRAIDSARCPECGWEIDRSQTARSRLPWIYRAGAMGRWTAYWRTVWLATAHVKRLAMEVARPVDLPDARRFATITGLIAGVPFALAMLGVMIAMGGTNFLNPISVDPYSYAMGGLPKHADLVIPYAAGVTRWWVYPLGIVLSGWLLARCTSLWFLFGLRRQQSGDDEAERVRQSRAIALSYYAAAPMAYLPLALALAAAGYATSLINPPANSLLWVLWALMLASWVAGFGCIVLCWLNPLRLMSRTLRASGMRLLATAIGLPFTWAICVGIGLLAWPWVAGFILLMVDSLRP